MECGAKHSSALPGCVAITVYSIASNRATRDKCIRSCANAPLKKCGATMVSSATSTPGDRKVQRRTCVTRGSHGFLRNLDTGHRQSPYP